MELVALRNEIDEIDRQLSALFVRRMALSAQIAAVKAAEGLPVFQPAREESVLAAVCANAPEALRGDLRELYRTIFALSRKRQEEA